MIHLEPLGGDYEDETTQWNRIYPLAAAKPNARYIGEIYSTSSCSDLRAVLEPQNIRFMYLGEGNNPFYALPHLTFTFLSDFTHNRVGYVDVSLDSLAALDWVIGSNSMMSLTRFWRQQPRNMHAMA